LAYSKGSRSADISTAGEETPSRLVTCAPSRSSLVKSSPERPRDARLWWICSASVLLPEPIVP